MRCVYIAYRILTGGIRESRLEHRDVNKLHEHASEGAQKVPFELYGEKDAKKRSSSAWRNPGGTHGSSWVSWEGIGHCRVSATRGIVISSSVWYLPFLLLGIVEYRKAFAQNTWRNGHSCSKSLGLVHHSLVELWEKEERGWFSRRSTI